MTTILTTHLDEQATVDVLRPAGDIASVYLGPPPAAADLEWEARWHAQALRLRFDGAPEPLIESLGQAVLQTSPVRAAAASAELAAFANEDGLLRIFQLPGLNQPDSARFGGPAHLVPLLTWRQQHLPYVLVVTDRTGADLQACAGGGQPPRAWSVDGPDDEIERNAPGGWAQLRYQHRAEDSWRHNAGAVAQASAHALEQTGARLLIVSGDVRAVQLLRERLPAWVHSAVTILHITGSRSADGSQRHRPAAVADVVRAAAEEHASSLLARFTERRGPGGLAVEGEVATLDALAHGRVAVLLVVPELTEGRMAWFGAEPTQVRPASHRRRPTASAPTSGPLADVAIRSALLAGAQVQVLERGWPAAPLEGIGGLCRFH